MTFLAVGTCFSFRGAFKGGEGFAGQGTSKHANAKQRGSGLGGKIATADFTGAEEFGGEFLFHRICGVVGFVVTGRWRAITG
jgi:hypothetical protein